MSPAIRADVAVLGGGSGGYAAAIRSAQLGRSVALVEAASVGGTCLHRGCIPTKTLLRVGEVADLARDGARYGVRTRLDAIDMNDVHAFKDGVIKRFHIGLTSLLQSLDITIIEGYGRLIDANTIAAGQQTVTADAIIVATGSTPKTVPGIPIGGRILTSDEALNLDTIPAKVAVLGGGVIGVEFASLWASLGSSVTVVEALSTLLPSEDADSVKYLNRALRRRKIHVRTGATVSEVVQDSQQVIVNFDAGDPLIVDYLLVAVGRRPRTEDLGLDTVGIEVVDGFIKTDQRLQTSQHGVYAVGDVVAGPQLAHRSFQQGIFVAEEFAGRQPRMPDDATIPRITYSHPEVAAVGLTEAQARMQHGDSVRVAQYDLAGNAKSFLLNTAGTVKVVTTGDGTVLGIHMVGDRVGELIGEAQILCALGVSASSASELVHAHPSQSEALGEALMAVAGSPLHGH